MIFKNIQAIHIPEFTIITKFLNRPRIPEGGGTVPEIPTREFFSKFTRGSCVESFIKIVAF